jgi:hypothetical protein
VARGQGGGIRKRSAAFAQGANLHRQLDDQVVLIECHQRGRQADGQPGGGVAGGGIPASQKRHQ